MGLLSQKTTIPFRIIKSLCRHKLEPMSSFKWECTDASRGVGMEISHADGRFLNVKASNVRAKCLARRQTMAAKGTWTAAPLYTRRILPCDKRYVECIKRKPGMEISIKADCSKGAGVVLCL